MFGITQYFFIFVAGHVSVSHQSFGSANTFLKNFENQRNLDFYLNCITALKVLLIAPTQTFTARKQFSFFEIQELYFYQIS